MKGMAEGSIAGFGAGRGRLRLARVRSDRTYQMPFLVNLGQRNAEITNRYLMPLRKLWPWTGAFAFIGPGYDLIHSLNSVPLLTRLPYIISFEDFIPRTPTDIRVAALERVLTQRIARQQCVALVAMSRYALRQMRAQHRHSPELPALLAKTEVIHPAVPARDVRPRPMGQRLRLLFVGNDYMRKGLPVLARAHATLVRWGIPAESTAVTALRWNRRDYIGPPDRDIVECEKMRLFRSGVRILPKLQNLEVMQLMRESDFLVMPTFHDTFGYVVLEALSHATPVIATNTCAMPEMIEHGRNGWLLDFPNESEVGKWQGIYRNADPDYTARYAAELDRLGVELADALARLWDERREHEAMSAAALEAARRRFGQERARDRIEALYERCLAWGRANGEKTFFSFR